MAPLRSVRALSAPVSVLVLIIGLTTGSAAAVDVPFAKQLVAPDFTGAAVVRAADLDADGDLDLVGASPSSGIAWWESAGNGAVWIEQSINAFTGAVMVDPVDVDGDGDLDALGASEDVGVAWFENDSGDGSSWTAHTIETEFQMGITLDANGVDGADLDGDGDLDVLATTSINGATLWWENSSGDGSTWVRHAVDGTLSGESSISAHDVDGDGDLDAVGTSQSRGVVWWENTAGDGSSWFRRSLDDSFTGVDFADAADLDGDGDLDIVSAANLANAATWWENSAGDGTSWVERTLNGAFSGALSVRAADLDGDGDVDVLGTATGQDEVSWWENTVGDGSSWTERTIENTFGGGALAVDPADVDGDGDLDVVGAVTGDNDIAWWKNETIHRSALYPAETNVDGDFNGALTAHAADVDGDGDLDLLGAALTDDDIAWWENTSGDGTAWSERTIDGGFNGAWSVFTADVDGDGDLDALGTAFDGGDIAWWENTAGDGTTWTERTIDDSFDWAAPLYAADIDGDGDVDVLAGSVLGSHVSWWENTAGDGTAWTERTIDADFRSVTSLYAADVDGDGDTDVLGSATLDSEVAWWENTAGDGTAWTKQSVDTAFTGASSVYAADVDGDGDLDVLGAGFNINDIVWWENTAGDGTAWTEHAVDSNFGGAFAVRAADVDCDGDLDVIGGASGADELSWWENTSGDGTSWTEHPVATGFDTQSLAIADIDGDGRLDLAAAAFSNDDVTWWRNRGGQFALATGDLAPARVLGGETAAALEIELFHRGRMSIDPAVRLTTLELRLEDGVGTPLSDAQVDDLLAELAVYADDGSGSFEAGLDSKIASVTSFSLTSGVQAVSFAVDEPAAVVPFGTSKTYFVVLSFETDAGMATPRDLRVIHVTESSSTAQDADHDIPLSLEFVADTPSQVVAVNAPPLALGDMASVLEDSGTVSGNVLDGTSGGLDSDANLDALTAVLISGPSNGTLVGSLASNGAFTYQPAADFSGVDSFSYLANDGLENGNIATVTLNVLPVNDAPSFTILSSITSGQSAGPQTVAAFASQILAGPPSESSQQLTFDILGNTNPGLFSVGPELASDGTLTFTPEGSNLGVATLTVRLMDDGGTDDSGVDTSPSQTFEIAIVDDIAPRVVSVDATPGGPLEACEDLQVATTELVITFNESMLDAPGDSDPADVTNPGNYQLIAAGPDRDIDTVACDALIGDDVLLTAAGATATSSTVATLSFDSSLPDSLYRLLICQTLEDSANNVLAEDFSLTFRQSKDNAFRHGQFDCELGVWEGSPFENVTWLEDDVDDASQSGSAVLAGSLGSPVASAQCIVDASDPTFSLDASVRVDANLGDLVELNLFCEIYAEASCIGELIATAQDSVVLGPSAGWLDIAARLQLDGGRSAICGISADLTTGGGDFEVLVDDFRLRIDLFADGFESGGTSAWSATVP